MAAERQQQLNQNFENLLKKPVLITCPRQPIDQPQSLNVALGNAATAQKPDQAFAQNSSSENSRTSILLDHVAPNNPQQQQRPKQKMDNSHNEQLLQLQKLWDEIKEQKNQLLQEIKDCQLNVKTTANAAVPSQLNNVAKQDPHKSKETKRKLKNVEIQTDQNGQRYVCIQQGGGDKTTDSSAPVNIIINVKGNDSPGREPAKNNLLPTKGLSENIKQKKYPHTPGRKSSKTVTDHVINTDPDGSSTSTAYHGLPNRINTELSQALSAPKPTTAAAAAGKSTRRKTVQSPALAHYITRLLGMTRSSIEQLGVSSVSTVETASSSIINGSSNVSTSSVANIDDDRLDKLQRFIDDNHSFLSSIDESLMKTTGGNDDADLAQVETVWMQTLQEKEAEMKRHRSKNPKVTVTVTEEQVQAVKVTNVTAAPQPIRPILKKPSVGVAAAAKDNALLMQTFDDVTDNCSRRIANLTEMISKVRQEKQKLMESAFSTTNNTLKVVSSTATSSPSSQQSGGGAKAQNSTEYLDFENVDANDGGGGGGREQEARSTTPEESVATEEMARRLVGSKQMGISRDSGICVSRPITATGLRDSPVEAPFQPTAEMIKEIEDRSQVKPPPTVAKR